MPSINSKNQGVKTLAKIFVKEFGFTQKEYRKALSTLRSALKIVEKDMSNKEWEKIDYEAVPSRANILYRIAFLRNDEKRRRDFLSSLQKGEAKINASVLYPYEIIKPIVDVLGVNMVQINPLSANILKELDRVINTISE